jgi:hypothetical protein
MAVDYLGQRVRGGGLDCRLNPVLLIRAELWKLQQDLRLIGSSCRLHGLDLSTVLTRIRSLYFLLGNQVVIRIAAAAWFHPSPD